MASADDEYTPEERRLIDARLAEAEKGPYFGPFKDGDEIAAFLAEPKATVEGETVDQMADETLQGLLEYGRERGKASGYTEDDIPRLVKEWRRERPK